LSFVPLALTRFDGFKREVTMILFRASRDESQSLNLLTNGEELTRLMVQYGVAVRIERTIEFRKLDLDYFEDEGCAAV